MHAVSLLFSVILALTLMTTMKSIAVSQNNVALIETICEFFFVVFDTLEELFILTALFETSDNELFVTLLRESSSSIVQSFIVSIRFEISSTLFRLINERLITKESNSDLFSIYYELVIEIDSFVLKSLLFGEEEKRDTTFAVINACDVDKNRILILLLSSQRKSASSNSLVFFFFFFYRLVTLIFFSMIRVRDKAVWREIWNLFTIEIFSRWDSFQF
jgi:hypothetical protein